MQETEYKKAFPDAEMRTFSMGDVEVRASESGKKILRGYAMKFEQEYDLGPFTESIARGALDGADISDVRILKNHDMNVVLGRTKAGTAKVWVDDIGLGYEAELPDTQDARDLAISVERRDIDQASWAFQLAHTREKRADDWEMRASGKEHRTIKKIRTVLDASIVTYPANPDTTAAKRSRDEFMAEYNHHELLNQRRKEIASFLAQHK